MTEANTINSMLEQLTNNDNLTLKELGVKNGKSFELWEDTETNKRYFVGEFYD